MFRNKGRKMFQRGIAFCICFSLLFGEYFPGMQSYAADTGENAQAQEDGVNKESEEYEESQIVLFYDAANEQKVADAVSEYEDEILSTTHTPMGTVVVVEVNSESSVQERTETYQNIDGVLNAQPNYRYQSWTGMEHDVYPSWYESLTSLTEGKRQLRGLHKQNVLIAILDDGNETQTKATIDHVLGEEYGNHITTFHRTSTTSAQIVESIAMSISRGASVIDLNLHSGASQKDYILSRMCAYAKDADVLLVAPAGDGSTDDWNGPSDFESVAGVIAVGEDKNRIDESNYGKTKTFSAPGRMSTITSAAIVASIAAILKSSDGTLSMSKIAELLKDGTTDIYTKGRDAESGYGIVNLNQSAKILLTLSGKTQEEQTQEKAASDDTSPSEESAKGEADPPVSQSVYSTSSVSSGQVVNLRMKANGKTANSLVNYKEYNTGYAGYVYGAMGADAVVVGMSGSKVKFAISGVIGVVNESDVQVLDYSKCKSRSYYVVTNGRLIHYIAQNVTKSGSYYTLDNGPAPSYLRSGTKYYSYDGNYFYAYSASGYKYMAMDYNQYNRIHSVNPTKPYYNYFQFLPLRSYSNYSASKINTIIKDNSSSSSKMRNAGSSLVAAQNTYGVNALAMIAVAANESAWGTNTFAKKRNNLFSINAVDSNSSLANYFSSVKSCINEFANTYMSKRYCKPTYSYYKGAFLGNKGSGANVSYASDPYWGEKAANLMWKIDKKYGSRDAYKYTLGIKDTPSGRHTNVAVKSSSTGSSKTLYYTKLQSNVSFNVLSTTPEKGYYKIQSDGAVNGTRTGLSSSGAYNASRMYGYTAAGSVKIVSYRNPALSNISPDSLAGGVSGFSNTRKTTASLTLSWKRNSVVSGYQIYYATARNGKYKLLKTISNNNTTSVKQTGLKMGQEYYYKIRAYKTEGRALSYSRFSSTLRAYTSVGYSRAAKTRSSCKVRKYAGTSYSKVISVPRKQKMTVYCATKDKAGATWYRVKFKYKKKTRYGYVKGKQVSITKTGKVKVASISMKKKAGTSHKTIKKLKYRTKITIKKSVTDTNHTKWYYVYYNKGKKTYKGYVETSSIGK